MRKRENEEPFSNSLYPCYAYCSLGIQYNICICWVRLSCELLMKKNGIEKNGLKEKTRFYWSKYRYLFELLVILTTSQDLPFVSQEHFILFANTDPFVGMRCAKLTFNSPLTITGRMPLTRRSGNRTGIRAPVVIENAVPSKLQHDL